MGNDQGSAQLVLPPGVSIWNFNFSLINDCFLFISWLFNFP